MKTFIDGNITRRAHETNPFIKNALKLINNAIYGRSLLNQLNYATDSKICQNRDILVRSFAKPTFKKVDIIREDRALVTYNKSHVKVDSPIYIGFSILDSAKLLMYRFWYDVLVQHYGDRVEFVYSDTDSFIINIKTENIDDELQGILGDHLDFSNLPHNHPLYSERCKGALGKLKLETGSHYIKEFVGLRPKAYCYTTTASTQDSFITLKGIPKHVRNLLTLEEYKSCLTQNNKIYTDVYNLRFHQSEMCLLKTVKLAISCFEDKRYYKDALTSYGYGHPIIETLGDDDDNSDDNDDDSRNINRKLANLYIANDHIYIIFCNT